MFSKTGKTCAETTSPDLCYQMVAYMSLFSNDIVVGYACRFSIQLIVFIAVGLATLKIWRYYRRNPYSFLHYIFLFFVVLLMHTTVTLSVYSLRILGLPGLPEAVMPMLSHALKIGWVILFLYAFIVTISGMQSIKQYFLIVNLFLMVFISSTVWLNWLHYLDTTNPNQLTSGFFWGQLMLEAWMTLLLAYGLFFARRVHTAMKGSFLLAITLLICQLLFHCWNIISSHNPPLWTFVVDRMLLLLFSAVTMVSVFSYSKVVKGGDGDSSESLQRDSGLVRDEVQRVL
jgi:hypothetical protein